MRRQLQVLALAGTLAIAALALASPARSGAAGPDDGADPWCQDPQLVDALGPACPATHGWTVRLDDGTILRTHGPDPDPYEGGPGAIEGGNLDANPDPPVCVSDASQPHNHLVYAHPQDVPSRLDAVRDDLVRMVAEANGFLEEEARQEGHVLEYRFLCSGGDLVVDEVTLPHDNSDASFWRVVNDLQDAGYDNTQDKYWIWYDDRADVVGWGGTANVYSDERRVADNRNNRGPSYAVTWGIFEPSIMLHEAAHTMGAVQPGAPHFYDNHGGWHCYDEADVMCYGDNAQRVDYWEAEAYCPARVAFDCGKDDYFDPSPEEGTYLATHWNMASDLNRFVERRPCAPYVSHRQAPDLAPSPAPAAPTQARDAYVCGDPADAGLGDDADGHRLGASGTGDAEGTAAASGAGDAHGSVAASGAGQGQGRYAGASGAGPASGLVALSAAGPAETGHRYCVSEDHVCPLGDGQGVAASGLGGAEGRVAASGAGPARGQLAVSGGDDASSCPGPFRCLAASGLGDSEAGTAAVSGAGAAHGGLLGASAAGPASGAVAASGTGPASGGIVVSGAGDADGIVAASGTGEAEGSFVAVSGCEALREQAGTEAACTGGGVEAVLP